MTSKRSRPGTKTANFGTGKRESHDAAAFYERFEVPTISDSAHVVEPAAKDQVFCGDARYMADDEVAPNSVALVVTSPPYFAGKEYEEALGVGHIPDSYKQYLEMLRDVFACCVEKLEDGGRIAVNVANLGRRPYRSLSADVINILQNDLKLLLRGEIIWRKAQGASGSCAWGSFQSPMNPVLRDTTERIIIASKGRFDRAFSRTQRQSQDLPAGVTLFKDDFMEWTTDVWDIPPESATKVNHPAPFPVELPQRLIELFTFRGDLVLDPFMGSGTSAIAARLSGRHYVGYDTDADYVNAARKRIDRELGVAADIAESEPLINVPVGRSSLNADEDYFDFALRVGLGAKEVAAEVLNRSSFKSVVAKARTGIGIEVDFTAKDAARQKFVFLVAGPLGCARPGLMRSEAVWRNIGRAAAITANDPDARVILLTTDLPGPNSSNAKVLDASLDGPIFDIIDVFDADDRKRLDEHGANKLPNSR